MIYDALDEHCMNGMWKKLWPKALNTGRRFMVESDVTDTKKAIVIMVQRVRFEEVNEEYVDKLYWDDLSDEDLLDMEEKYIREKLESDSEEAECVRDFTM
jgi:Ran GTPase-activating protein (RanGAP) involved in mRNA processing and transport